jgi:hypothetical protein
MSTIDTIFSEMDRVKAKYNRQEILGFFFEFATELMDYTGTPKTQENYNNIISWKMYYLSKHLYKIYDKNKSLKEQIIKMPSYKEIPACLPVEVDNWNKYQQKLVDIK